MKLSTGPHREIALYFENHHVVTGELPVRARKSHLETICNMRAASNLIVSGVILLNGLSFAAELAKTRGRSTSPITGIQTPGIQIPFASLKPEAEIAVPGYVTGIAFGEPIHLTVRDKGAVVRLVAKTNRIEDPTVEAIGPCSSAVSAFGGVWAADCNAGKLIRFDTKAKKLSDGIAVPALAGTTLAASTDSLWLVSDSKTTLSRIDPDRNAVVAETRLPADCPSVAFGEGAVWVACPSEDKLLRIHPLTNLVEQRIEVVGAPAALAIGEGSVWVLTEREGKVVRIDPKTNKITATVELKTPATRGSIATGEGAVWVSVPGFPLTRIDPATDKVMQQFAGHGEGMLFVGSGSVWLAQRDAKMVRRYDPKRIRATLAE